MSITNVTPREQELAAINVRLQHENAILKADRDVLWAEREGLKCQRDCFHHLMQKHGLHPGRTDDDLLEILDVALAERDALKADALRYRWLREGNFTGQWLLSEVNGGWQQGMDTAIDAAMKEQQA